MRDSARQAVVKKQAGVGTFVFPKRDTATCPKAMADAQAGGKK
jgi:hypothetical protein